MVGYIGWVNQNALGLLADNLTLWIFQRTFGAKWYLAMEARAEAASTGEDLATITRRKTEETDKIHRQMSADVEAHNKRNTDEEVEDDAG